VQTVARGEEIPTSFRSLLETADHLSLDLVSFPIGENVGHVYVPTENQLFPIPLF
jgi:hypothetical protein